MKEILKCYSLKVRELLEIDTISIFYILEIDFSEPSITVRLEIAQAYSNVVKY